ncbi:MAG TPA: hypothetical protein VGA82_01320 [Dehalococcoidales bacterium]
MRVETSMEPALENARISIIIEDRPQLVVRLAAVTRVSADQHVMLDYHGEL